MNAYDIILKPVMSEKAYDGIHKKIYTFKVARNANKIEIKQAVEQIFGVKVEKASIPSTSEASSKDREKRGLHLQIQKSGRKALPATARQSSSSESLA